MIDEKLHEAVSRLLCMAGAESGWNERFLLSVGECGLVLLSAIPEGAKIEDWVVAPNPVRGQSFYWSGERYLMLKA